jgi:hypothetical protein
MLPDVAVTVKLNVPAAVGVPVNAPVEASESPLGKLPLETANVGEGPPLAVIVAE